jgi:serine/threonine-protein kinase
MATSDDRELQPGERIAGTNYVVIRRESGGGHGTLYRVRHHRLERRIFALKVLHANLRNNAELARRMEREAQIVSAMNHPNIVTVFDAGTTEEVDSASGESSPRPFLAMEWLKGRSLAQVLAGVRKSGIGLQASLEIATELADALDYAHTRHGVVHRDIKPDNVFLQAVPTQRGVQTVTKLLDFGVASVMGVDRITKKGMMIGTPRYAAPEQLRGDSATPKTDFYELGLVLYEMLVGFGPFDQYASFGAVTRAHLEEAPSPLPERDFPAAIVRLVMRCLAKHPDERPAHANEVASELREISRGADEQRQRALADLSRTDPSPVQNVLTQAGGESTDPGPPPVAAEPTAREADVRTAAPLLRTLENAAPFVDTPKVGSTPKATAIPKPDPAAPPVDRGAETRSFEPATPHAAPRTDTQPITPGEAEALQAPDARFKVVGDRLVFIGDEEQPARQRATPRERPAALSTGAGAALAGDIVEGQSSAVGPADGRSRSRRRSLRYAIASVAIAAVVLAAIGSVSRNGGHTESSATTPPAAVRRAAAQTEPPVPSSPPEIITAPAEASSAVTSSRPLPPATAARLPQARASSNAPPIGLHPSPTAAPRASDSVSEFKTTFR